MWPEQVHILLTYNCNFECDHCFVYSGPEAAGTFTLSQLRALLDQARAIPSVERIYFEGGEAFLYYPLLIEGVREARERGFEVGLVTNSYWADCEENALLWLRPLAELGIADLSVSDDEFHLGTDSSATRAVAAAQKLGMTVDTIRIARPGVEATPTHGRGEPITGGPVMFRGRAVEKLTAGLPTRPWESLMECPYEELERPNRVHVDSYGHVHVCQGISIGNVWQTPLARLVAEYDPGTHPISGPLVRGGPARLAEEHGFLPDDGYVDECHLCYLTRRSLLDEFADQLAPRQVYGL
ncbi:MAG: radical SAM protein [Gemmatimonadales bacterium]|nr:radical SAM protein [Gemmatimonadales bacterium]